jgi:hypothetical protein
MAATCGSNVKESGLRPDINPCVFYSTNGTDNASILSTIWSSVDATSVYSARRARLVGSD